MLYEVKDVKQFEDEGPRRWFTDNSFDLIVWYDRRKSITGFQLCYDKENRERCLTWKKESGYSHNSIDSGEIPGQAKMSPILVADGLFEGKRIAGQFRKESARIDGKVADFVYKKLLAYPRSR